MNAPAILPAHAIDASDLAATVERARLLLDAGDVLAAKVLAARAHDEARAAAALAERYGAAEKLIAKARRLQGEALLIETRARIAIADDWDAARAAGLVSKGGRPGAEKPVSDGNGFTAADTGLTRKEIHEARKLAEAERARPGIVEQAIAARLADGLSATRANLRAAVGTASATAQERGDNFYQTPPEAVAALLALESFDGPIWEPACGKGAISRLLEAAGHEVILSDLVDRGAATTDGELQAVADFLETDAGFVEGDFDLVTNPPYGAVLNRFVAHALRVHRPRRMALLLNLNFLCGFDDPERNFAMDANPPARVHVFTRRLPMMHREGWDGPISDSRMNTAWFVWERQEAATAAGRSGKQKRAGGYTGPTVLNRVDWMDYQPETGTAEDMP